MTYMYRQYENPRELQTRLEKLIQQYEDMQCAGADDGALYDKYCEICEMRDRVNFAWQDEEYDCTAEL